MTKYMQMRKIAQYSKSLFQSGGTAQQYYWASKAFFTDTRVPTGDSQEFWAPLYMLQPQAPVNQANSNLPMKLKLWQDLSNFGNIISIFSSSLPPVMDIASVWMPAHQFLLSSTQACLGWAGLSISVPLGKTLFCCLVSLLFFLHPHVTIVTSTHATVITDFHISFFANL